MMDQLATIAENVKLFEGEKGVRAFIEFIGRNPGSSLEEAAFVLRIPIPVLGAVRREAEKVGILERKNGLQLSDTALKEFPTARTLDISAHKEKFEKSLTSFFSERPAYKPELDQAHLTIESSFARAQEILSSLPVPSSILIIGDDDLVSVSVAFLARNLGIVLRVYVLEYDVRLVDYIQKISRELDLSIEVAEHDTRNTFPDSLKDAFDVIETDPPYTILGLQTFLKTGIQSLKKEMGGKILLSFPQLPPAAQLEFYDALKELRLVVREIKSRFNVYIGATLYGNTSDLFILEYVPESVHTRKSERFYTKEVKAE